MVVFSNARLSATFADWPLSGSKRGDCRFAVETNTKGSRVLRTTTGKPKASTYADKAAIVDGSDGKTYLLFHHQRYGSINIYRSDFKSPDLGDQDNVVFQRSDPEQFATLLKLIDSAC